MLKKSPIKKTPLIHYIQYRDRNRSGQPFYFPVKNFLSLPCYVTHYKKVEWDERDALFFKK